MEDRRLYLVLLLSFSIISSTITSSSPNHHPSWGLNYDIHIIDPDVCTGAPAKTRLCTSDCAQIVLCIPGAPTEVANCHEQQLHCLPTTKGPECSRLSLCGGPIICGQSGQYPDPDLCTQYHTCTQPNETSTVTQCAIGTAYNIEKNVCDLDTSAPVCGPDGPVPICTSITQRGALPDNPSYYYLCKRENTVLYPSLHWCGDDNEYDASTGRCSIEVTRKWTYFSLE